MKKLMLMAFLVLLSGCQKEAEGTQVAGSGGFNVQKLFTVDGCSVYRFWDARTVYYTNCSGGTQFSEGCGKNCTYERSVSGGAQ